VTIKKIAIIIKATQPAITLLMLMLLSNIKAMTIPKSAGNIPDSPNNSHEAMTRPIAQRRCSPAFAPLKLAPVSLALVKFVPRMSDSLKFAPERSFPLKD
jgi:hypothetical protein